MRRAVILGYNTGNSRNGFYERDLDTSYGRLHIKVPRDRNGHFEQQLIPDYARRTDEPETTIITLYKKGINTREISFWITHSIRRRPQRITRRWWNPSKNAGWSISPRSKSNFLMKMHLSASYAAIIVIWIVPTLSGCNVASVKPPPKYYNCLKKNFKPPINKM